MKYLSSLFLLTLLSHSAFAHNGGSTLVCHSSKHSGSEQLIDLRLARQNGTGLFSPVIELKINKEKFKYSTHDINNNYGETFHNSPLKVITVTVAVPDSDHGTTGYLSLVAIPETVKAFDDQEKPVKWSLESEKAECYDSNGTAQFKAIFKGFLKTDDNAVNLDTQVLDCELSYDSGMAC